MAAVKSKKSNTGEPITAVVRISQPWINFIVKCGLQYPYSELLLRVVGGQPIDVEVVHNKHRLDKEPTVPDWIRQLPIEKKNEELGN